MRILIVGGGKAGSFLADVLSEKFRVTVIEIDPDRCRELNDKLANTRVVCEDGCEPWVLEEAGVANSDVVLAVTGDDEDNLVISYLCKYEYDVPKVIARVNNPKNSWLFTPSWGVDVSVSSPDIIAKIVEEETSLGEVVTLLKLRKGDIALVEITVPDDSPSLGISLAELKLPPETIIVTIGREEALLLPSAETSLMPNDRILAVTNIKNEEVLKRLLGHGQ